MSLTSSTSILTSSLINFQTALQQTSNNIANVDTPGYSRRTVNFAETAPGFLGSMSFGSGAFISSISRLRDVYLDSQIRSQLVQMGYNSSVNTSMQQLASFFPDISDVTSASGISNLISNFYSSWSALASSASPNSNNAAKQVVITNAVALANQLRLTMQNLSNFNTGLSSQVGTTVNQINSLTNQIAIYNGQVKEGQGASVLDAREQAMEQLAQLIDVQFVTTADGTVNVFFSKGSLVSGAIATDLTTMKGLPDAMLTKVGYPAGAGASDVTDAITGGELGGLLKAYHTVQDTLFSVRAIGSGLIQNTNLIYHAAADASGAHTDFFNGTSAGDILVNPTLSGSVTGAALLASFSPLGTPGDLANSMAKSANDYAASYVQSVKPIGAPISGSAPISTLVIPFPGTSFSASGTIHIDLSSGSSAVVNWNNTQSLTTVANNITTALAGAGTAVYDETTEKFTILSNQPISMYDASGNFSTAARLAAFLTSATNVNTNLDPTISPINKGAAFNLDPGLNLMPNSLLSYFETALPKGSFSVDGGTTITWDNTYNMQGGPKGVLGFISASTGAQISASFSTALQEVIMTSNVISPTAANPIKSFDVTDSTGNFTRMTSIQSPSSVQNTYAGMIAGISQQQTLADARLQTTQGVVSSLQDIQDSKSKVNLDQEMAQAMQYRNAYEASLRVISVIDDMLNVLINHTAAATTIDTTGSLSGN